MTTPAVGRRVHSAAEASRMFRRVALAMIDAGQLPQGTLEHTEWGVHDRALGDDWVIVAGRMVYPIAARVSWGADYGTFTIRSITDNGSRDTELAKRGTAYLHGGLTPQHRVVQVHASHEGVPLAGYVVAAAALYGHILVPGPGGQRFEACVGPARRNYAGGQFVAVAITRGGKGWAHAGTSLEEHAVPVGVWRP